MILSCILFFFWFFSATIFVAGNGTISSIISSKVMLAFNHVFDVLRGDSRCRFAFLNDFFFDLLVVHNLTLKKCPANRANWKQ